MSKEDGKSLKKEALKVLEEVKQDIQFNDCRSLMCVYINMDGRIGFNAAVSQRALTHLVGILEKVKYDLIQLIEGEGEVKNVSK